MTIETEIEYVESQLRIGHHIKDTFEEMQQQNRKLWQHWDQLLQHCEQLPQQRNQRQHAKAKQLRKQILQDMTAITQLNQSISSMRHTLRVLYNKMHIHSSTKVNSSTKEDSEEHDKKDKILDGENSTDEGKTLEKEMEEVVERNLEIQELVKEHLKRDDEKEDALKKSENKIEALNKREALLKSRLEALDKMQMEAGLFSRY
ncbi:hypothetical protein PHAVU_003G009900 [Phaseolus vulgaris]|uniref:Uncharacterized protein n=1 Tax=Phaseolus vulgaris TaxID=3885 RepID=V7C8A8_PHAVU|nr:hypothetical protein PHAVU_003G009900g [Phaseolus vulgaris]ESW25131.1 hypothetical protein PHAVU_003G009900g [Phaseolus vulgaris]